MRYTLLTALIFLGSITYAQNSIQDGIAAFENREYEKAVATLSPLMQNEHSLKDKDRAAGWYYLGQAKSA